MKKKKMGSRKLFIMWAVCITVMLSGCGKKEEAPDSEEQVQQTQETQASVEETEAAQETEEEEPQELAVQINELEPQELKNDEGTILLTNQTSEVSVTIPGNPEAQEAVNQFFADLQDSYGATVSEYKDMAQEDLTFREEEGLTDGWAGYGIGRSYTAARVDEQMISIVEDSYEYTGGAHPNSVRVAYNFDTQTGKRMTLEDVASDLDEIRIRSTEYLREMLSKPEYAEELFEGYENDLEDILTDSTWYTDEQGFHIICNEYIITPHSAGILDFLLPYDEVDVVAGKYIPASSSASPDGMSGEETEETSGETTDDQSASQHNSED